MHPQFEQDGTRTDGDGRLRRLDEFGRSCTKSDAQQGRSNLKSVWTLWHAESETAAAPLRYGITRSRVDYAVDDTVNQNPVFRQPCASSF